MGLSSSPDGWLAVADGANCEVALVTVEEPAGLLRRVGGCGRGPGEMSRPYSVAVTADSLIVYDAGNWELLVLDHFGNEGRRLRMPEALPLGIQIGRLLVVDDTTWLAALQIGPGRRPDGLVMEPHDELLAYLDARTGVIRSTFHRDDDIALRNGADLGRGALLCVAPTSPEAVSVYSVWTFVGHVYEPPAMIPTRSIPPPVAPELRDRGNGRQMWPVGFFNAECNGSWSLFRYLRTEGEENRVIGGHLALHGLDGSVLLSRPVTRADSALFGRPATWIGERYFVGSNNTFGFPVIVEFAVVEGG